MNSAICIDYANWTQLPIFSSIVSAVFSTLHDLFWFCWSWKEKGLHKVLRRRASVSKTLYGYCPSSIQAIGSRNLLFLNIKTEIMRKLNSSTRRIMHAFFVLLQNHSVCTVLPIVAKTCNLMSVWETALIYYVIIYLGDIQESTVKATQKGWNDREKVNV